MPTSRQTLSQRWIRNSKSRDLHATNENYNGPTAQGQKHNKMSTTDGTEFAKELAQHFGNDRFYHCYLRNDGRIIDAICIYILLGPSEMRPWQVVEFFKSIGIMVEEMLVKNVPEEKIIDWSDMCRVAFGFCKFWKVLGRRSHELPDHIHARMILSEKNTWTEKYAAMLEDLKT